MSTKPAGSLAQTPELEEKYSRLIQLIAATGGAAVAFSGGTDSSLLCYAAYAALDRRAIAVTVVSPMLPRSEIDAAKAIARAIGIEHLLIEESAIEDEVARNAPDRCYHCKKCEFGAIQKAARERGIETVLDGSNRDDLGDYRPGLQAIAELGIVSPLREAGFSKKDVRELSRCLNLPTWDKPAAACLASRIPYGEAITAEKLAQIEAAEAILREFGFRQFRVRAHNDIARIEVAPEERKRFFDAAVLDDLSTKIKAAGFLYAAFELEGYRMGNLNRVLRHTKGE